MISEGINGPGIASRPYDEFIQRYGLTMLEEPGDLQIVDGDLAMTRDFDLKLGDIAYDAIYRLAEHWRHNETHVDYLFRLMALMIDRYDEAENRLNEASNIEDKRQREGVYLPRSPEFLKAWHAHYDEEGAAVFGQVTYSGCIVMLASNALERFRDDIGIKNKSDDRWTQSGPKFGGHSIGEIIVASANGFRHSDEWAKTRPPTNQQAQSINVLTDALGPIQPRTVETVQPGRCQEVLSLISGGEGMSKFTEAMLGFAHEVALKVRKHI